MINDEKVVDIYLNCGVDNRELKFIFPLIEAEFSAVIFGEIAELGKHRFAFIQ